MNESTENFSGHFWIVFCYGTSPLFELADYCTPWSQNSMFLLVCWHVGYWLMQVRFSLSIDIMYFRVRHKIVPIINHKKQEW